MDENEFDFESRIVSADFSEEDADNENALRPRSLDEYTGQEKSKEVLKIYIEAAKMRGNNKRGVNFTYHIFESFRCAVIGLGVSEVAACVKKSIKTVFVRGFDKSYSVRAVNKEALKFGMKLYSFKSPCL